MTTRAEIETARARVVRAGAALRDRSRDQTVASLGAVLDAWSDPEGPWQRRLVEALPAATGFSAANVREGLAAGLCDWSSRALRDLVETELGGLSGRALASGFASTSVVLAGAIPMPTILSLVAPLVLHTPVLAKTASRDPITAPLFRESLLQVDAALAAALEVVSFSGDDPACAQALLASPCVVATGSDETVAAIARGLGSGTRFVGYGHRLSVAVLDESALSPEYATAVARDLSLWDQLGCLSPIAVFVVGAGAPAVDRFAEGLADSLARAEAARPRGEIPASAAAALRAERDGAQMRRAAGADLRVHSGEGIRFVVVRESDALARPAPLHRFVRVHPVADRAALGEALAPLAPHLAGVALAGFGSARQALARELAGLGASRVCAPGTLQTPPLSWHHDNQPILLPLARLADIEPSG